jgi:hypothetical protein
LLEFFFQTLFLIAQCRAVSQRLQGRWFDVRQVDRQASHFEALALEAVENRFQGFDPSVAVVQRDALLTERQAEQRAVEQAHQALDVRLRELFTQTGVAVVVGVIELLLHRLQAFFQIAQTLVQILGS